MELKKLSEQVKDLANPQRSDTFIKKFRDAVLKGTIKAAYIPGERFTMPKQFTRRGTNESYTKDSRDMVFEYTPEFEQWFEETNRELAVSRKGGSIKPSIENIEAGLVDFEKMAAETRAKMKANVEKGRALGKSRGKKKKMSNY